MFVDLTCSATKMSFATRNPTWTYCSTIHSTVLLTAEVFMGACLRYSDSLMISNITNPMVPRKKSTSMTSVTMSCLCANPWHRNVLKQHCLTIAHPVRIGIHCRLGHNARQFFQSTLTTRHTQSNALTVNSKKSILEMAFPCLVVLELLAYSCKDLIHTSLGSL